MPPLGPDLEHLAARCRDHPEGMAFAALAEGLRKAGQTSEAMEAVEAGLRHRPDSVPGLLVLARIQMDGADTAAAGATLQRALGIDPAHPVVLEALATVAAAAGDLPASRAWREARDASLPEGSDGRDADSDGAESDPDASADDEGDPLLSESLAALYQRQGHLGRAHEVYAALAARDPSNVGLAARRDDLETRLASTRPLPYDARQSHGTSLRSWLGTLAEAGPSAPAPADGYDAFYQAEPTPGPSGSDFDAFQSWLRGLPK